jgi:hypothetical protein
MWHAQTFSVKREGWVLWSPGMLAVATVKATNVSVEIPKTG